MLNATPADLATIGWTAFGGDSPYPPGFRLPDLDNIVLYALHAAGYPSAGTVEHGRLQDRFLDELARASGQAPPWAVVGALGVAINFTTEEGRQRPQFLDLMDQALVVLRDDGVAFTAIPPLALERWESTHGRDGLAPADWPSALEPRPVPEVGMEPATSDLVDDEWRKVSCDGPTAEARSTFAHRSSEGSIVAIVDGIDLSDGQRKQWPLGVEGDSYTAFLRALGDRLVTPPWWAHEDLVPYFPCRQRSRAELRALAPTGTQW